MKLDGPRNRLERIRIGSRGAFRVSSKLLPVARRTSQGDHRTSTLVRR